jgi:gamma-glutamyl hercynylcysteine S-oxide synthase
MLATHIDVTSGQDLIEQIREARRRTDDLFSLVKLDSLYERPIPERHRIIFYVGHLEAFDWNLFHERVLGVKSFHPEFDRLFAFGIDPVGGGLPSDQPSDWPSVSQVREYVRKVRETLDEKLENALPDSVSPAADGFPLATLLNVAIEHRLMHAETLAYMLHQLSFDHKIRHAETVSTSAEPVNHESVEIPGGAITLGLSRDSETFGWDNEFDAHTVNVPAFSIDRYKITNKQYLEFIAAGGYQTRSFWGEDKKEDKKQDDWNWISERGISHPAFWRRDGDRWLYRTMFEDVPLPLDWPVYVSLAEANAYARWAGKSLPTETEWQRAAFGLPGEASVNTRKLDSRIGYEQPGEKRGGKLGNYNFLRWSPVPVNSEPANRSAFGVHGMLGNGWEWTSTPFAPFPGFKPFPFYPGYSADFFDGKHFIMKGGSARTAACMLRPTFRNWFQAHYQFIYTGFRCVSRRS